MFNRKSTGLVREGRWIDSFIFNSSSSWLFGPLVFAIADLYYLSGADLISAEGIALIFALCIAIMYAFLTSVMPRSGGDYVFNSRILHPSIGFAFNFSLTVWQLFSAAFTLYFIANVALSPGLEVLGFFGGIPWITQLGVSLGQPTNSFIFATVVNTLFSLVMLSGIRKTFNVLNVLWALTIIGTMVMIVSLLRSNSSTFQSAFNSYVTATNGTSSVPDPFSFFVSNGAPTAIPYALAIPAIAICASSVIWVFWETYLGGEIRKATSFRRNVSTMAGAAILNGALFVLLVYLLYQVVGFQFLAAVTNTTIPGSPFFSPLSAVSAVLILTTGNFYSASIVILAATLGYAVILLPALYLQPIRSMFSWSFDRIVPEKMSSVNSRFHTPIIATTIAFVVIQAALVLIESEYNSLLTIFYAVIIGPAFSSIFPTSLSAIAFRSRSKRLLATSPVLGVAQTSLITILGFVSLGFILFMTYVFAANEALFALNNSLVIMNFIFIPIGAVIYFASWSIRRSHNKIDLNRIVLEIPPE